MAILSSEILVMAIATFSAFGLLKVLIRLRSLAIIFLAECFHNIISLVSSNCNFRKARPCTAQREKIMIMITSKQLVITDFNTYLLAHSAVTPEHQPAEAAAELWSHY